MQFTVTIENSSLASVNFQCPILASTVIRNITQAMSSIGIDAGEYSFRMSGQAKSEAVALAEISKKIPSGVQSCSIIASRGAARIVSMKAWVASWFPDLRSLSTDAKTRIRGMEEKVASLLNGCDPEKPAFFIGPEYYFSKLGEGYSSGSIAYDDAEAAQVCKAMMDLSGKFPNAVIVPGTMFWRGAGKAKNEMLLFFAGSMSKYQKKEVAGDDLMAGGLQHYEPGQDGGVQFDFGGIQCGAQICADSAARKFSGISVYLLASFGVGVWTPAAPCCLWSDGKGDGKVRLQTAVGIEQHQGVEGKLAQFVDIPLFEADASKYQSSAGWARPANLGIASSESK